MLVMQSIMGRDGTPFPRQDESLFPSRRCLVAFPIFTRSCILNCRRVCFRKHMCSGRGTAQSEIGSHDDIFTDKALFNVSLS